MKVCADIYSLHTGVIIMGSVGWNTRSKQNTKSEIRLNLTHSNANHFTNFTHFESMKP